MKPETETDYNWKISVMISENYVDTKNLTSNSCKLIDANFTARFQTA